MGGVNARDARELHISPDTGRTAAVSVLQCGQGHAEVAIKAQRILTDHIRPRERARLGRSCRSPCIVILISANNASSNRCTEGSTLALDKERSNDARTAVTAHVETAQRFACN